MVALLTTHQPLDKQAPQFKYWIENALISGCTCFICCWGYIGLEVTNERRFHKFCTPSLLLQPPLSQVYLSNQVSDIKFNTYRLYATYQVYILHWLLELYWFRSYTRKKCSQKHGSTVLTWFVEGWRWWVRGRGRTNIMHDETLSISFMLN